ncbi:MAG: ribonuclease H-like domain-containing protein [Candidatus Methylomirabilales bacterium]
MKAYLDIETSFLGEITVIGLYAEDRGLLQLVGGGISEVALWKALEGIRVICTYNGNRFDLPVIRRRLGLDLLSGFTCHDLMYECWRYRLYGGLKRVEEQLNIPRRSRGIDGIEAMRLWHRYETTQNTGALMALLEYNREDVLNLETLDQILTGMVSCG